MDSARVCRGTGLCLFLVSTSPTAPTALTMLRAAAACLPKGEQGCIAWGGGNTQKHRVIATSRPHSTILHTLTTATVPTTAVDLPDAFGRGRGARISPKRSRRGSNPQSPDHPKNRSQTPCHWATRPMVVTPRGVTGWARRGGEGTCAFRGGVAGWRWLR